MNKSTQNDNIGRRKGVKVHYKRPGKSHVPFIYVGTYEGAAGERVLLLVDRVPHDVLAAGAGGVVAPENPVPVDGAR
eukprot:8400176-Pyramimonas_sp.AAC.1